MDISVTSERKSFLKNTAKDYDMCYVTVLKIYNETKNGNEIGENFYNELEWFLENRRKNPYGNK